LKIIDPVETRTPSFTMKNMKGMKKKIDSFVLFVVSLFLVLF